MKPNEAVQVSPRKSLVLALWRQVRAHSVELSLFLCLWFAYGVALNSRNQSAFNLQQAGVEAIVERRQFKLEGSATPQLQLHVYYDGDRPFSDVFLYHGSQYANKQPGQFLAGACAYFFLHLFGLSYARNYLLTSALVSFFTTSLVTAAAAVAVFATVRELIDDEKLCWPMTCALIYGLGTVVFVYSGVAHHDGLASGYLAIAFYLVTRLASRRTRGREARLLAAGAGFLLGLTVTTSLLPMLMAGVVGLYVVSLRRWDLTLPALIGGMAGLAPLLFYNAVCFGNPFEPAYIVGGYPDTYVYLNLRNTLTKIRFYAIYITIYVPIAWVSLVGLLFYPRQLWRERLVIFGLMIALSIQILNMDSQGECQYGPRFLLPAMAFACIGLVGFHYLHAKMPKVLAISTMILAAAVSIVVNSAGAIYGAMYCEPRVYALWPALAAIRGGAWKDLPLAGWLLIPLVSSVTLLIYSVRNYRPPPTPAM